MQRNINLVLFSIAFGFLILLLWITTGSIVPASGSQMLWFHSGLFGLIVARFIIEHKFTKPNDAFLNSLAVFVALSTLDDPPYVEWWNGLKWLAFTCGVLAIYLSWDTRQDSESELSRLRRFAYGFVTSFGQATVIFSIVFVLSILSYFDSEDAITKVLVISWGAILLTANMRFDRLVLSLFAHKPAETLGYATSFLTPSLLFFERSKDVRLKKHQLIGIKNRASKEIDALGFVVGERRSPSKTWYVANLIDSTIGDQEINRDATIVNISNDQAKEFLGDDSEVLNQTSKAIGVSAEGTTVSTLTFEVFDDSDIVAGSLVLANTSKDAIYFQVFDGLISEDQSIDQTKRAFVYGNAQQLGQWANDEKGFVTYGWVAKETTPVILAGEHDTEPKIELLEGETKIGKVPNSKFPAVISLDDLALFHSAILGVTGSGKSFLTFEVIEKVAKLDRKVVCVDPTGDYQRYLSNAVLLKSQKALKQFLNSRDHSIGILETAINTKNPILQTKEAAQICLDWCKNQRQDDQIIKPEPKILFVLEEAHLLVPEWNFNPDKGLQSVVNQTSQIVLQARKYGLGFLVVAQRTANVTKSVLNQCNTIIALQQFDETGFDFLTNYMGRYHVQSLPNMLERHGIVVGKASNSQRPILVRFNDQHRTINQNGCDEMPIEGAEERDIDKVKISPASEIGAA